MITSQDKLLISRLIKKYAGNVSTESMLVFVGDNTGMLSICRELVNSNNQNDESVVSWVDEQCHEQNVDVRGFLYEVEKILSVFLPDHEVEEYYTVLGLEDGASDEEIKKAYRLLSRKYHPDTASAEDAGNGDMFVQITKAYHALSEGEKRSSEYRSSAAPVDNWRGQKKNHVSSDRKKKNLFWFTALASVMVIISLIVARSYQQRAMIAGLQSSRAAFIPPESPVQLVDNSIDKPAVPEAPPESKDIKESESTDEPVEEARDTVENLQPDVTGQLSSPDKPKISENVELDHKNNPIVRQQSTSETASPLPVPTSEQAIEPVKIPIPAKRVKENELIISKTEKLEENISRTIAETVTAETETAPSAPKTEEKNEPVKRPVSVEIAKDKPKKVIPPKQKNSSVQSSVRKNLQEQVEVSPATEEHAVPTAEEIQEATQKKIEYFITEYTKSYTNKDLFAFSHFFDMAATENGKPLAEILPTYSELFQNSEVVSLTVSILKWSNIENMIELDGRFEINIQYKSGEKVSGAGIIAFQLIDSGNQLLIKDTTYQFDI